MMFSRDGKSKILAAVGSLVVCLCSAELPAAQQTATWLGGTGSWLDPTKWSGGVVPSNSGSDSFDVVVDGNGSTASSVAYSSSSIPFLNSTVGSLLVSAGDFLRVGEPESWHQPDRTLTLNGEATIDGELQISGGGDVVLANGQTLGGTGVVTMFGFSSIRASTGSTVIGSQLLVRAKPSGGADFSYYYNGTPIGDPSRPLINHGRIVVENGQLGISASNFMNLGVIEVRTDGLLILDIDTSRSNLANFVEAGGTVAIAPGRTFDNTGGTFNLDSSSWALQGRIRRGTLTGTRPLYVPYLDTGTLDGVTLDNVKIELSGSLKVINGLSGTGAIVYGNPEAIEGSGNIDLPVVPPGIRILGSPFDNYLGDPFAIKGVIRLNENQGFIRASKTTTLPLDGRTTLEGTVILNRGTLELSPNSTMGVQGSNFGSSTLAFADDGKLIIDGGGLLKFAADLGTLDLSSSLDQLIVHAKPDGTPYDMTKIVDGQLTTGVFNSVTDGITVTYLGGDIFISGTPTPEPASLVFAVLLPLACKRARHRD